MLPIRWPYVPACSLLLCFSAAEARADQPTRRQVNFFESKIRPVLVEHCYACHSAAAEELKGGLVLDTRTGIRRGGDSGHAVVPFAVADSLLIDALKYDGLEMPPAGKLPADVIQDFERWVAMGAPDPRDGERERTPVKRTQRTRLWSLEPIQDAAPPPVESVTWPRSGIDRFILARHERAGVRAAQDAGRAVLLRRLCFDLIGLPPSPAEIEAFINDASEQALERVVDRLLASAHFGERWARHWLDVVRYGESAGNSRDVLMPYAWRYRDYVIDALNADMPYDQFIREQIAGDLLPADSPQDRDRMTIATGLLAIGSKSLNGGNLALDIADDQIDVISRAMLGLTVSCARCHDHKFDPIPTGDYYALAGIFRSTETLYGGGTKRPQKLDEKLKVYLPLGGGANVALQEFSQAQTELGRLQKQEAAARKRVARLARRLPQGWQQRKAELVQAAGELPSAEQMLLKRISAYERARSSLQAFKEQRERLRASLPQVELAVGVRDAKQIRDWPVQIRGDKNNRGAVVRRGFLTCVELPSGSTIATNGQSGRVELAAWLTHPGHPLTARVIVNRVWQHLFGQGLVRTVDNFGTNGLPPTHPQLLDYLAHRFTRAHAWSLKSLIRELLLTRTYQLSSAYDADAYAADPANELLWRRNRRRVEAEPLRDALLAAAGTLDTNRPRGSLVMQIGEGEVGRNLDTRCLDEPFLHRSVYLPVIRGMVPEFLKLFDFPEPSNIQGQRDLTNVSAQSLFLMNNPWVIEQSNSLARRVLDHTGNSAARLEALYKICLARTPTVSEIERSREYLRQAQANASRERQMFAWSSLCQTMFARAEFRYID